VLKARVAEFSFNQNGYLAMVEWSMLPSVAILATGLLATEQKYG